MADSLEHAETCPLGNAEVMGDELCNCDLEGRLQAQNAALQSRLTEMEAREAVYRKALERARANLSHLTQIRGGHECNPAICSACLIEAALANPTPGAARLLLVEKARELLDIICKVVHHGYHMLDDSEESAQTGLVTIDARNYDDHGNFCAALERLFEILPEYPLDHGTLRRELASFIASPAQQEVLSGCAVRAVIQQEAAGRTSLPSATLTEYGTALVLEGGKLGCLDCGEPYGSPRFPDLIIPPAIWEKISPNHDGGGLICPNCINARLEAAGLEFVPAKFTSGPMSDNRPSALGKLVERLETAAAGLENGPYTSIKETRELLRAAAAALREKEGFLWCCHVRGPDDVIPTVDYASALKMADEINGHIRATDDARARMEAIAKQKPDQNWPKVSAVPAPWPWSAEAHAKGLLASNRFCTAEPPTGGSHG